MVVLVLQVHQSEDVSKVSGIPAWDRKAGRFSGIYTYVLQHYWFLKLYRPVQVVYSWKLVSWWHCASWWVGRVEHLNYVFVLLRTKLILNFCALNWSQWFSEWHYQPLWIGSVFLLVFKIKLLENVTVEALTEQTTRDKMLSSERFLDKICQKAELQCALTFGVSMISQKYWKWKAA